MIASSRWLSVDERVSVYLTVIGAAWIHPSMLIVILMLDLIFAQASGAGAGRSQCPSCPGGRGKNGLSGARAGTGMTAGV